MNTPDELRNLYLPPTDSHKGQNGKLLIIGGSRLFHAASLWALQVASRIVDLVHYSSVKENNKIVHELKKEFREGIVVPREHIEDYIEEDDCVLIGPGMVRTENSKFKIQNAKLSPRQSVGDPAAAGQLKIQNLKDIENIENEGLQTYYLTKYLLQKYPHKRWVIDAGALQMMEPEWIPKEAILTPHRREFELLKLKTSTFAKAMVDKQNSKLKCKTKISNLTKDVTIFSKKYNCTVLIKGKEDIIASKEKREIITGGNVGMTKGGTGDVLAGLVAALYCKNDAFTSAVCASYINKKAGDELFKKQGYWFNASDLADEIPRTMKRLILDTK